MEADCIVIDEYTHLSPLDFLILEKFSVLHNNVKPISIFLMGDEIQEGFTLDVSKESGTVNKIRPSSIFAYRSPLLTDMIRSGYNNKIDNII